MKILRLHLKAYGPFTDTKLDLSGGQHGLHVIYGVNEAGKSSSLRAIVDLLYGIPGQTPDNFVHPYRKLRIGAELQHSDGSILEMVRRKANKNSLFDADDSKPLEDALLDRFLADVDRDLFHMMFGIDHERLRHGGEEIVKGGGRIGELLFSAGAGISDLQSAQKLLNEEIDQLLKASGRSGAIIDDIKEYKDAQDEVKAALVTADTWKHHDEQLQSAQRRKDSLDEKIRVAQGERNRLVRIRDATTAIGQWKKAKNDLSAVADIPLLPDDFEKESNDLLLALRNAEQQTTDAEKALKSLNEELAELTIPEELLQEADATEAIRDRLGGHRKAMADRPRLETKFEEAENEAKEILRELGRAPDLSKIEELRLPNDKTVRIQNLGNQQEALVERLRSSRRDCDKIRSAISRIEEEVGNLQVPPDDEGLKDVLETIQSGGDWEGQLRSLQEEIEELQGTAAIELSQLGLWSGELEELEELAVPSLETIEQFSDDMKAKEAEVRSARTRVREKVEEKSSLNQQLAKLELGQTVPTEENLNQARELRNAGWQLILASWDSRPDLDSSVDDFLQKFPTSSSLLEAYRRSVDDADQIGDQLRQDADRVAAKSRIQFEIDQCERNIKKFEEDLEKLEKESSGIESRWIEIWAPLSIKPLSPAEMRDWLRRQQQLVETAGQLRTKRLQVKRLATRIDEMIGDLVTTLQKVDSDCQVDGCSLNELLRLGAGKIEEIRTAQNRRDQQIKDLDTNRQDLVEAESRFEEAEQDLGNWRADWATEMEALGLSDGALPSQANSVLQDIGRLFQKFRDADQLRIRLDGIDRDAREFASDVKKLVGKTLPELAKKSPEDAVSLLSTRLKEARLDQEKRDSLSRQIEKQGEKLKGAESASSEATTALDEMCRLASCDSHDQLSQAAIQSRRRRELESTVRGLEESISGQSGGMDFDTFLQEVESEPLDIDLIQPRIDELEGQVKELNGERDTVIGQIKEENIELAKIDGGSKASELSLKRESIASRLEERVQELARLRLAAAVLHAAIEEYREKNQGPVLSRASEIFSRITLDGFSGLQADFDERGEPVLTGVRKSSGEKITVAGMSDGTCDQLYLALRLASLENWLSRHEPLPLIVDDVLLNFDDNRAIAGLKVLAELSRHTQVVFFTHHQHLVDMARDNLSSEDVFVTTLGDGAAAP
ncbi:MAG: AAA family ATPase [Planctomycetales bacterium]|nr:AAA family ATPase [Planctomycetales bacterium]